MLNFPHASDMALTASATRLVQSSHGPFRHFGLNVRGVGCLCGVSGYGG